MGLLRGLERYCRGIEGGRVCEKKENEKKRKKWWLGTSFLVEER